MKLKSIYKYLIWQQGKSYLIYFGIIFVIVHLGLLLTLCIDTNGSFGGMEMGTVIFMMISGIVFYRESLALSMQNGISRKTFFMALILGFITISVLAAAGDSIINIIGNTYEKHTKMFQIHSFIDVNLLYPTIFLMDFTMYITVSSLGVLIGALLYRLNRILKIIIPLSLWLIFQIGSVIILFIDFKFADNKIIEAFLKFIQWLEESVYHLTAVLPCIAVLLTAIAFLFVRRVPLNDNKK